MHARAQLLLPCLLIACVACGGTEELARAEARLAKELGPLDPAGYPEPELDLHALEPRPATERGAVSRDWIRSHGSWTQEDRAAVRAWLDDRGYQLAETYRLAREPAEVEEAIPGEVPRWALAIPATARAVALDGLLAMDTGRWNDADRAAATLGRLVEAVEARPVLIHQIVGTEADTARLELVHALATHPSTPESVLQRLRDDLQPFDPADRYRRAISLEAGLVLDNYRHDPDGLWSDRRSRWFPGSARRDVASVLDAYRELGLLGSIPYAEDPHEHYRSPERQVPKVVMDLLAPNLFAVIGKLQLRAGERRLARTALAVRLEARSRGAYPEDLESVGGPPEMPLTATAAEYRRLPTGGAVVSGGPEPERQLKDLGDTSPNLGSWVLPALTET